METILIWITIGAVFGYLWGRYTTTKVFTILFKTFTDEVHRQYCFLLKKHNIEVRPDFKEIKQVSSRK